MTPTILRAVILLGLLAACFSSAAGQANDTCSGAIPVAFPSVTAGNNSSATTTPGLGCNNTKELWYYFIAPSDGAVRVTTNAALGGFGDFDTILSIYTFPVGAACVIASGQMIICRDDSWGTPQSDVVFSMFSGVSYFIAIGGYSGSSGNFALNVTSVALWNDFCVGALPITVGSTVMGTTNPATEGAGDPVASCGNMINDLWYSFVAPSCGTYTVTTCPGSNYDTLVAVWQGSCASPTQVACNDNSCSAPGQGLSSTLSFPGVMGTLYRIELGGHANAGNYALTLTVNPLPPMALSFFNDGPGTIGYSISNGPPSGLAFTGISLNPGLYPNGWFYGIDISLGDLFAQWTLGVPFVTPITSCILTTVGPFGPLPPGLTLYGVTLGVPNGGSVLPTVITPPASGTVP